MDLLGSGVWSALAGVACIAMALYVRHKNTYSYWKRKGVAGPAPWPLIGHSYHLFFTDKSRLLRQWAAQYGPVWGIYMGSEPRLMIADPELVREIAVKEFETFPNHHADEFFNKFQKSNLFFMQSPHWKRVRAIMSPTFTSGKIKRMFSLLDVCADDLVENVNEQMQANAKSPDCDNTLILNVKDLYSLYAMDGITSCCYSMKLQRAGASNITKMASRDDFVNSAMKPFKVNPFRLMTALLLPTKLLKSFGFTLSSESCFTGILARSSAVLEARLRNNRETDPNKKRHFDDYLQLLIEARLGGQELELDENDASENYYAALTHESLIDDQRRLVNQASVGEKQAPEESADGHQSTTNLNGSMSTQNKEVLSEFEMLTGVAFFLMVGLETTASLLTNCSYALAFHPEIQQRLHEELSQIAKFDPVRKAYTFEYDTLKACHYLDAVMAETLRMLTPFGFIDRKATCDYHIKKYDIRIPANGVVLLVGTSLHSNEQYWPEPDKFNPERFMPGNKEKIVPGAYMPFGMGPRHCIGMRFSLAESKLGLAKLMMNYKFEPAPGLGWPPKYDPSGGLIVRIEKPFVKFVARRPTPM